MYNQPLCIPKPNPIRPRSVIQKNATNIPPTKRLVSPTQKRQRYLYKIKPSQVMVQYMLVHREMLVMLQAARFLISVRSYFLLFLLLFFFFFSIAHFFGFKTTPHHHHHHHYPNVVTTTRSNC